MIKFLMYLFETGLCLSILLLVYWLFFRKETYFQFNRFYLVGIIFFSLLIPLLHLNFHVQNTQRYEFSFNEIGKFRSYYEQLIAMTDPDYLQNQKNNIIFEDEQLQHNLNSSTSNVNIILHSESKLISKEKAAVKNRKLSIASIFLVIYLLGVLFFLSRMIYLGNWLKRLIKISSVENKGGFKLVKLSKNLPPFSFLNYVFVNPKMQEDKSLEQVINHEITHIKHKHSLDLLLAHACTIFQWFNPFTWFLQKNIKTNHEFIADREVVKQGFDLLNYQELLLNQFLKIKSVELVHNFNLISIKKRITMMNKIKSGFLAKFKVLLIIPAAIFTFFLFANLTLNSSGNVLKNFNFFESYQQMKAVKGLWKNVSEENYGKMVLIENMKLSVIDHQNFLEEHPLQLDENKFIIGLPENKKTTLKYELTGDKLKIWWSSTNFSTYTKSSYTNTLDESLSDYKTSIDLPVIKNYSLLTREDLCIDILMVDKQIYVNKEETSYGDLKEKILEEKLKINQLNSHLITIRLYADKNLSMKYMHKLNQVLREINLLKVAHMGKIAEHDVSKLQKGFAGMPKKLPPLNVKEIKLTDLKDKSISYFEMDTRVKGITPEILKSKLETLLSKSGKYISGLYYNENTTLQTYLGYQDMARTVVYKFRNEYAQKDYRFNYDDLPPAQQKEIRKLYPLIISEKYFETK